MRELRSHEGWVFDVAFSPDGTTLASAGRDATVCVSDTATGAEILRFQHPAPDARVARSRGPLAGTPRAFFLSVAFAPDSETLFVGDRIRYPAQPAVRSWAIPSGRPLLTFGKPRGGIHALFVAGDLLAGADHSAEVHLWEWATGRERQRITFDDFQEVRSMAWSPDGRTIAAASLWVQDGGQVWPVRLVLWDVPGNQQRAHLGSFGEDSIDSLTFSPDSHLLAAGFESGIIRLWETTGTSVRSLQAHPPGAGLTLAFTPDGKTLHSGDGDGTVRCWDVGTGRPLVAFDWGIGRVRTIAVAPDGMTAAAGGNDGRVILWDLDA
jgi:WD40 repeat protein